MQLAVIPTPDVIRISLIGYSKPSVQAKAADVLSMFGLVYSEVKTTRVLEVQFTGRNLVFDPFAHVHSTPVAASYSPEGGSMDIIKRKVLLPKKDYPVER